MAVERGFLCCEGLEFVTREEPAARQGGIQRARRMAFAQHEPVTLSGQRMHRIDVKHAGVKGDENAGDGEVAAKVAQPRPVDHVQVVVAHALGHLTQGGRGLRG
jgi:hypothetical protein